ncbi:ABC transporter substrate-binding protein [Flindersiella endophytica]
MSRRTGGTPRRLSMFRRVGLLATAMLALAGGAVACTGQRSDNHILIWTSLSSQDDVSYQQKIIDAFKKENPGVTVDIVGKSGQFTGDNTALIAAVRGGSAPNVFITDRFTVANQASIGLLTNLQPYVDKDREATGKSLVSEYLPFSIDEASYQGNLYALPFDTDARGLFYNRKVLREAGISDADMEFLDPKNGPPTIDQVIALGKRVNQTDKKGNYTRMGIIPWDGQAFHATWGLIYGAKFFNQKTCQVTPQEPAFKDAFGDFAKWSKEFDYQKVQAYLATYRPPNADPATSPFYTGRLGMAVDGNWSLANIKKYAPKLDYGVTYLPVPKAGDPPMTWAGGFGLVMPKGAPNPDLTWKFMKFYAGEQGQRLYIKAATKIPTWKSLLNDKSVTQGQGIFPGMMKFATNRPALPVGAQISDAMDAAQQGVLLGEETPDSALQTVYDRVQPQMQQFCPFTLKPAT